MTVSYKLAANFNTVTIENIDYEHDLLDMLDWDNEVQYNNSGEPKWDVSDEELVRRLLQREYDIIAGIKVVPQLGMAAQGEKTGVKEDEKPSQKQIDWAKSLGMKNPENASKKEVWLYIQQNKK